MMIVLLQLPLPLLTRYVIDKVLPEKKIELLFWVILGLLISMILRFIFGVLTGYFFTIFRERVLINIHLKLYNHLQNLDMSFFKDSQVGYLMSRINGDINNLQGLLAESFINFLQNVITLLVGITFMFIFNWKLAIMSILILPFFVYSLHFFSGRIRRVSRKLQEKFALVGASIQESFSAISLIKSFQLERDEYKKLEKRLNEKLKAAIQSNIISSLSGYTSIFIGGIGPLIVLWYGGKEVMAGNLSLGTLIAFNAFLAYLINPGRSLMNLNERIQTSLASLDRVVELFNLSPRIKDPESPIYPEIMTPRIEFKDVCFSYTSGNHVLNKFNLTISEGEKVAIVGKSGVGKTTILNLLLRFYDPQRGVVYLNSINIKELKLDYLRSQIGVVEQEPFLFSGTVKENIKRGNLRASDEEILEASILAHAHEFIKQLPHGYESEVGEKGSKLSGGQRQRLAIARLILKNPKIFILDEATSYLDSESEKLIQETIYKLMREKTTIVIAHRFSTILNADKIVVLKDAQKIAEGKHSDLYHSCKYYRKLCENQFIQDDPPSEKKENDNKKPPILYKRRNLK
jgi:subfamily B ATP-binding cassette protein MsbA